MHKEQRTLVVNLLGGPGAGKSTMMGGLFARLKRAEINCEMATEFAKDLVWDRSPHLLANQIYVFGVQHHRIWRLQDQVQVVITDAPLIHSIVYGDPKSKLGQLVWGEHQKLWNYNVFIERRKKYVESGRVHTEAEAHQIDAQVKQLLDKYEEFVSIEGTEFGEKLLASKVVEFIDAHTS